jgi:diguanylate cyclase (GGDEF)-like protein
MSLLVIIPWDRKIGHRCLSRTRFGADIHNMTLLTPASRTRLSAVGGWLPRGSTLPESQWQVRHRAVTWLLLFHAVVFAVFSLAKHLPLADVLTNVSVPALGALAASRPSLSRGPRTAIAAISLMLSSSVVVHLMNGSIEGHFHFFVMIPVVALYEDWVPFGLAVGVVLVHHGLIGTLAPTAVYDHRSAIDHPWRWAFVHAFFFASACVGAIINWKLHETARAAEQCLTARVRHQAHHDPLTGLPNRTQLLEHAASLLADPTRRGEPLAVLLIDLDRFKDVNDVLGHASGDVLLSRVGPLMASAVRGDDILCRLGGDEFAAVLPGCDEATAVAVARRLLEQISVTMDIDGVLLNVEASVGIAVTQAFREGDIDVLLSHADIAMYTAKRARTGYQVYETAQDTATRERLNLLGEMRQALLRDEFVLHYQPKLTLPDNKLIGVEALARWQHPTRGLLGPAEFIPVAESTGLIVPFTLHVLRKALEQVAQWQGGDAPLSIAVNLSPRCLAEVDLPTQILGMLTSYGVPASLLELEITENTLAHDPDRALATLTELHEAGIKISIDDFGTGYSSMSYLKRLPVSELKVDRSFVMGMLSNLDDGILVRSVVDLGHNLGLIVVAEGVEDQETLEALAEFGCDVAQGYHLARPMPGEAFEAWRAGRSGVLTALIR